MLWFTFYMSGHLSDRALQSTLYSVSSLGDFKTLANSMSTKLNVCPPICFLPQLVMSSFIPRCNSVAIIEIAHNQAITKIKYVDFTL